MKEETSASLVARVRDIILATFDVSTEQAQEQAYGLATLAEGWGGPDVQRLDWTHAVKKHLGETFRWRSAADRKLFYSERDLVVRSYDRYIHDNRRR